MITAENRPAPEARFHVLDGRKFKQIETVKRSHPKANLLVGLLYAEAGMLDEAAENFRALVRANPKSALARELLNKVQTARSPER